jgi:hypothetical protein
VPPSVFNLPRKSPKLVLIWHQARLVNFGSCRLVCRAAGPVPWLSVGAARYVISSPLLFSSRVKRADQRLQLLCALTCCWFQLVASCSAPGLSSCSASDVVCWPSRVRSSHPEARTGSFLSVQHRQTVSHQGFGFLNFEILILVRVCELLQDLVSIILLSYRIEKLEIF